MQADEAERSTGEEGEAPQSPVAVAVTSTLPARSTPSHTGASHREPLTVCEPLPSMADGAWVPTVGPGVPFPDPFSTTAAALHDGALHDSEHLFGGLPVSPLAPAFPVSHTAPQLSVTSVSAAPAPGSPWWDAVLYSEAGLPEIGDVDMPAAAHSHA